MESSASVGVGPVVSVSVSVSEEKDGALGRYIIGIWNALYRANECQNSKENSFRFSVAWMLRAQPQLTKLPRLANPTLTRSEVPSLNCALTAPHSGQNVLRVKFRY